MNRQDFLNQVSKEVHFKFDRKSIEKELSEHLDDSIVDLMEEGLSRDEAEAQAVLHMGEPEEIGKLLNKEHHPVLGYVWMTSKILLIAAAIMASVVFVMCIQSGLDLLFPYNRTGYGIAESWPVGMKIETANHNVVIDYIGVNEWDEYFFTYRAKTKMEYIRVRPLFVDLEIGSSESELENASYNIKTDGVFGTVGHVQFEWPEDNVLYLDGGIDGIVKLDLEEYWR